MKPPQKWSPSDQQITTYMAFEDAYRGDRVVFISRMFNGKPRSARFVANMSYDLVTRLIKTGRIYLAEQSGEYREWLREELL